MFIVHDKKGKLWTVFKAKKKKTSNNPKSIHSNKYSPYYWKSENKIHRMEIFEYNGPTLKKVLFIAFCTFFKFCIMYFGHIHLFLPNSS